MLCSFTFFFYACSSINNNKLTLTPHWTPPQGNREKICWFNSNQLLNMQNKHRSRAQRHFVFVVLDGLYLTPQNTYPTWVYVERRALSCYTCINRVAVTAAAESTLRPTAQRAHPTEARKKNFHHEPNKPHHAASAALAPDGSAAALHPAGYLLVGWIVWRKYCIVCGLSCVVRKPHPSSN